MLFPETLVKVLFLACYQVVLSYVPVCVQRMILPEGRAETVVQRPILKVSPPQGRRTQASTDLMEILHMKAEADQKAKEREERIRPQEEQDQKRRGDEERWRLLEEERCRCLEERRRRFEEEQERREVEREKRFLEERETLKEGREQLRAAALVEAQLRREELELMRRDLASREATAAEERKDRNLLLKLLSDQIAKNDSSSVCSMLSFANS